MFSFSPRVEQVLALARKEARRLGHNYVGTEHMLLGIIRLNQGVAVNVLRRRGIDLEVVRGDIEKMVGPGPAGEVKGNIPYTPRVKRSLALAGKQAKDLLHTTVGTEHLLLGLIKEGDGVAGSVLTKHGIDFAGARIEILKELGQTDPAAEEEKQTSSKRGGLFSWCRWF